MNTWTAQCDDVLAAIRTEKVLTEDIEAGSCKGNHRVQEGISVKKIRGDKAWPQ